MTITTLGTSHGDSTYCRFNSSTLYETGDAMYLVDCGAPCEGLLCRAGKDTSKLRAVFITHMHNDHVGGITELFKHLVKYPKPGRQVAVYLPEEGAAEALLVWLAAMHLKPKEDQVVFRVTRPGEVYRDENITVEAYPTDHIPHSPVKPVTFSYILNAGGKRVLHTGDLRADFKDYPAILLSEHFDALICEATHYKPESALPLLMESKIDRLIFSHVGNRWHGEAGEAALMEYCRPLKFPVSLAFDGDVFEV